MIRSIALTIILLYILILYTPVGNYVHIYIQNVSTFKIPNKNKL